MRNLFKNLFILSAVCSVLLFSCGDEEDPDIITDGPSALIDVEINGNSATSPATANVGDSVSADISIDAPGNFNVLIVYVIQGETTLETIRFSRDLLPDMDFTDFDASVTITESIPAEWAGSEVTYAFEVVDDANQIGTVSDFVLNVEEGIEVRTELLFGAQGNAEPGFYSVLSNERHAYASARDNSESIDFAYYWGSTNGNTIAAIDDAGLNVVYEAVSLPIDGIFATENATRFVATELSITDYEDIDNSSELYSEAFFEVGASSSVTQLQVDNVIAYQLSEDRGGSFGLIKIVSIDDTNGNGTIEIEVKASIVE